jgi:hypothetical protein
MEFNWNGNGVSAPPGAELNLLDDHLLTDLDDQTLQVRDAMG